LVLFNDIIVATTVSKSRGNSPDPISFECERMCRCSEVMGKCGHAIDEFEWQEYRHNKAISGSTEVSMFGLLLFNRCLEEVKWKG